MPDLEHDSAPLGELIERLEKSREPDNALDIAVDIALFQPEREPFVSVRANAAGTKLVYTAHDGHTETYWARDHTLNAETRQQAISELRALNSTEGGAA